MRSRQVFVDTWLQMPEMPFAFARFVVRFVHEVPTPMGQSSVPGGQRQPASTVAPGTKPQFGKFAGSMSTPGQSAEVAHSVTPVDTSVKQPPFCEFDDRLASVAPREAPASVRTPPPPLPVTALHAEPSQSSLA